MRSFRRSLCATAATVALVVAGPALAQPSDADKATARSLMMDGYDALEKNDARTAAERFRAANALVHVPTTELALATAEMAQGHLIAAYEALVRLSRIPSNGSDPPEFATARQRGSALRAALDGRIPSVRIVVSGGASDAAPVVKMDGEIIPIAALGQPRKVDPGKHAIVAELGGVSKNVDAVIREGESKIVEIVFETVHSARASAPIGDKGTAPSPRGLAPLTVVGLVVGAAGIVTGTTTGAFALNAKGSATNNGAANGECPPAAQSDCHRAQTFANVSTISFVVGGVGAAVALVSHVWLTPRPATSTGTAISPYVGIGSVGVAGRF